MTLQKSTISTATLSPHQIETIYHTGNTMSRGYNSSYRPGYYHGARSSSYLSSIQEARPSSGGSTGSRATTPVGRSTDGPSVGLTILADAIGSSNNRKASREARTFGLTSSFAPAAYKYFSRSDFYNPTVLFNRSMVSDSGIGGRAKREGKASFTYWVKSKKAYVI